MTWKDNIIHAIQVSWDCTGIWKKRTIISNGESLRRIQEGDEI